MLDDVELSAAEHADHLIAAAIAARPPTATYRVQFNTTFTFRDARAVAGYLHRLGAGALYASPYLKARPESTHGYDVTDHATLNPGVGTPDEQARMVEELHQLGMGHVLDVVPNHMGVGPANPWWIDVLENGQAAAHADAFDIDWQFFAQDGEEGGKVLLPVLGDQYGRVLENGELHLVFGRQEGVPNSDGTFFIRYWEYLLPVDPSSYTDLLRPAVEAAGAELGTANEWVLELQSIITAATNLPPRTAFGPDRMAERRREKEIIKRRLATLATIAPTVRAAIEGTVQSFEGTPGEPRSFDRLDELLGKQAYRLSFWRVAAEEINYRRFFDINDLAAIRPERPRVFAESHALVLDLVARGAVTGLRIDHIDGLWDPELYTVRLQAAALVALHGGDLPTDIRDDVREEIVDRWREAIERGETPPACPLWVVVEKILGAHEDLSPSWAVHGSTGYDTLNVLNGLFVDPGGRDALTDIYHRFSGRRERFGDIAYTAKLLIMDASMASELNVLARGLWRLARRDRRTRDFTLNLLTDAVREVVASFPVYRTYVTSRSVTVDERDRALIVTAVRHARRRAQTTDASVFDFIEATLTLTPASGETEEDADARRDWVMKFQQYTGPVTAKGVEDTAFYRYNRLLSLNEVGGEPDRFGVSVPAFHAHNAGWADGWPAAMTATATHDTKRGEDARARLNVLSEIPREWRTAVFRWGKASRRARGGGDGPAIDPNEEYLLYQALVGAWPPDLEEGSAPDAEFVQRIQEYMRKAVKEAKVNTSWINPDEPYDAAVEAFVARLLTPEPGSSFLPEFARLAGRVARLGGINSLAQTTLRVAGPGVPDIYQGTELWDLSLVDPDNRRPVDYEARDQALTEMGSVPEGEREGLARALLQSWPDGRVKLYTLHRALTLRRERPDLFVGGAYMPLDASGPHAAHVVAFARGEVGAEVIAVAPRLVARLTREPDGLPLGEAVWGTTRLHLPGRAGSRFRDRFTGRIVEVAAEGSGSVAVASVLASFPVALLEPS